MNAIELIVRHSFAPNRLRFCGQNDLSKRIPEFVASPTEHLEQELQSELQSFKGLYAYLCLIGRENGLQPFDEKVGEAYWIGNELLENVSLSSVQKLFLESFSAEDFWGKELAEQLANHLPEKFFVHHSFHVFLAHFFTKAVPITLQNLDNCRIAPGKVLEVRENTLLVETEPLEWRDNRVVAGKPVQKEIADPFSDPVEENDWVSFHWNTYCMQLEKEQKERLQFFSEWNLTALNVSP